MNPKAIIYWGFDGLRGGWAWVWHPSGVPDSDSCSGPLDGELPPFAGDEELLSQWSKEDIDCEVEIDREDAPAECWEYYTAFSADQSPVGPDTGYFGSEADARKHAEAAGWADNQYLVVRRVLPCEFCGTKRATLSQPMGWNAETNMPAHAPVCAACYDDPAEDDDSDDAGVYASWTADGTPEITRQSFGRDSRWFASRSEAEAAIAEFNSGRVE